MRALGSVFAFLLFPAWIWAGNNSLLVADVSSQVVQNERADADNLSRMRNVVMLQRFVEQGYLVHVPAQTRYFYLHEVPAPYRYCRPWTKLFLDRLSHQYYARFKQPLRVTSLVRTVERQNRLARRNSNAADASGPMRSSHLTGATLDVSKHSMSPQGQEWVRKTLYSLRQAGYLYAIEEFEQPVFHIMVYSNYSGYIKRLDRHSRTVKTADEKQNAERGGVPGGGQ